MRLRKALGCLRERLELLLEREVGAEDLRPESLTLDQLHRDVVRTATALGSRDHGLPDLVDRHDVRMVQRGGCLRLLDEACDQLLHVDQLRREDLDGDMPVQRRVVRLVDLSHSSDAENGDDRIVSDDSAGRE